MARKIDITVNNCHECPYCYFEAEVGETFCTYSPAGKLLGTALQEHGLNIYKAIHIDCPLPFIMEMDVDEPTFKCTALQVQEVNDCPEEWVKQIIQEEKAHDERIARGTFRDVEKMFEGFDETDEE